MTTDRKTAIERLRTFYAYMVGIPAQKVGLNSVRNIPGNDQENVGLIHRCGSTACVLGWAPAIPEFNEQGLDWKGYGPVLRQKGKRDIQSWDAVQTFFGLTAAQGDRMFAAAPDAIDEIEDFNKRSLAEKREALRRIRCQLVIWGAITGKRSAELAKQEKALTA